MKFKRIAAMLLAAAMVMSLVACGSSSSSSSSSDSSSSDAAEEETEDAEAEEEEEESDSLLGSDSATIRLTIGTTTAADGHYVLGLVAMQEKLEELSDGEMTLDIYPNSALGGESDMMDAVSLGTQDMVLSSTGPIPSFSSATSNWATLDLPYLFETKEDAYAVFDGEIGQELLDEFEGTGIKALGIWENGYRELTNNTKEIATPDDLAGMKIRTMENDVHMATYTALGATPTAMAWGEIFSALQQGTVDGQENPLAIILTAKVYEVQQYVSMIDLFYSPCVLMINEDTYNNFTDDQKAWFDEAAEYGKEQERAISQEIEDSAREQMEAEGVIFTDVDKEVWIEAVQSVYEDESLGIDQDLLARIQEATAD
ncbi:MAG: DctP family TRAP transporter solute-binding subunit [Lachnospiraceae bacterium]|nr:DctP family TRAP transporter solute-binding subunit [Lachnospiraceae bacterium]